jgi:hypothetical protein
MNNNNTCYSYTSGPGISVSIATNYGLDGLGIESRWGRDFPHLSIPTLWPTQPTGSFLGVEGGRGVTLTSHYFLVQRSKNRVEIYLYSPVGPSWPVKRVKPTYNYTINAQLIITFLLKASSRNALRNKMWK